jgi:hypothetical protein
MQLAPASHKLTKQVKQPREPANEIGMSVIGVENGISLSQSLLDNRMVHQQGSMRPMRNNEAYEINSRKSSEQWHVFKRQKEDQILNANNCAALNSIDLINEDLGRNNANSGNGLFDLNSYSQQNLVDYFKDVLVSSDTRHKQNSIDKDLPKVILLELENISNKESYRKRRPI